MSYLWNYAQESCSFLLCKFLVDYPVLWIASREINTIVECPGHWRHDINLNKYLHMPGKVFTLKFVYELSIADLKHLAIALQMCPTVVQRWGGKQRPALNGSREIWRQFLLTQIRAGLNQSRVLISVQWVAFSTFIADAIAVYEGWIPVVSEPPVFYFHVVPWVFLLIYIVFLIYRPC